MGRRATSPGPPASSGLEHRAAWSYLNPDRCHCSGAAMIQLSHDARTAAIREKVEAGQRLSFDDGVHLYEHVDLFTLGELAKLDREPKTCQLASHHVKPDRKPTQ